MQMKWMRQNDISVPVEFVRKLQATLKKACSSRQIKFRTRCQILELLKQLEEIRATSDSKGKIKISRMMVKSLLRFMMILLTYKEEVKKVFGILMNGK